MNQLTERQAETLCAVVSFHRVHGRAVTRSQLTRFVMGQTGAAKAAITGHLYRLVRMRFVDEQVEGFVPTIDGEAFVLGCQYMGHRRFGREVTMAVYGA